MKKLFLIITLFVVPFIGNTQETYYKKTKHKTVKRLSKSQLKRIKKGQSMYYRKDGKVYKTKRFNFGISRIKGLTKQK